MRLFKTLVILPSLLAFCHAAFADGEPPAPLKIDTGDTSWVLTSSALVLLMTPGLAFFYGGMVRSKNVVSTLFQNYMAIGVVGLLWAICGYSLAFSGNVGGLIGDFGYFMLRGVGQEPNPSFGPTLPHLVFMLFQAMFAIIAPALITGAFAERVRFSAWTAIMATWSLVVYVPVAHWVWGSGGWILNLGGLDFAGGLVVHVTAGTSALIAAMLFGKRKDFGRESHQPYDTGMVLLGTGLLIFGWFGFNAGSALGANGLAAQAFANTLFACCAAFLSWTVVDALLRGKPSAMGGAIGAVAGLVVITPAAGFVTAASAIVMGLIGGMVCNVASRVMKERLQLDDTLDVFGCHGVGGMLGAVLTAVFATKGVNAAGQDGLLYGSSALLKANLLGTVAVASYSMITTFVIIKAVNFITPVRVSDDDEESGLDRSQHDEHINELTHKHGRPAPSHLRKVA